MRSLGHELLDDNAAHAAAYRRLGVLDFFESTENAQRYLEESAGVSGMPISMSVAAAAGRVSFRAIVEDT